MAQTKHTRILTDEQFSEGTTVDGSRIDRALDETVATFNSLPPLATKTRFIPTDYVWGWTPEARLNGLTFEALITTAGTGYDVPTGNTPGAVSGTGSGLRIDIGVDGAGVLNGASVRISGTGNAAGETITLDRFVPTISASGSGYSTATKVPVSGGSGSGMTVDITTSGGAVATIDAISDCGTGYADTDSITIAAGNNDATFTLSRAVGDAVLTLASPLKHRWPWLSTWNRNAEVASGSSLPTDYLNDFRVKGTLVSGIINKEAGTEWPFGSQYAWTTELFVGSPAVLDSLQLVLCQDHTDSLFEEFEEGSGVTNFEWNSDYPSAGAVTGAPHVDLQLVVQVADIFDARIRAKDSAEVQRHTFAVQYDDFSFRSQEALPSGGATFDDMEPDLVDGGSIRGAAVQLKHLNIPIHQNAIMRISVVLPLYDDTTSPFWGDQPWNRQYYTLVATMLEETK